MRWTLSDRGEFSTQDEELLVVNQLSRWQWHFSRLFFSAFRKLRSKSSRETVISVKGCRLHRPQQFVALLTVIYCRSGEIYCSSFSQRWEWSPLIIFNLRTLPWRHPANWLWSHQRTCVGHSFFGWNPFRSHSEKRKLLFTAAHLIF